jgi:uncharacterized protein
METIVHILRSSVWILKEAAPYLIFGFAVAGILRMYVRPDSVAHYFYRGRFRSVVLAAFLGIPVPL